MTGALTTATSTAVKEQQSQRAALQPDVTSGPRITLKLGRVNSIECCGPPLDLPGNKTMLPSLGLNVYPPALNCAMA